MGSMSLSPHFLTRSISRLLGLVVVSWAFARVGVHRLSLRPPYLGVSIHSSSPAIGFHSRCFLYVRRICTHSVDPPLTHILGEFPGWLWYTMLWSQRRNRGAHEADISIQISALAGIEPQALASRGHERYH